MKKQELLWLAEDYKFKVIKDKYKDFETESFNEFMYHRGGAVTLMELINYIGDADDITLRSFMYELDRKRTQGELVKLATYINDRTLQYLKHKIEYCLPDLKSSVSNKLSKRLYTHMYEPLNYLMSECLMILVNKAVETVEEESVKEDTKIICN